LDINIKSKRKQLSKTILVYLILSVIAVIVDKVYGIFSHGVASKAMTWMFLYPLLGGALFYSAINLFFPNIIKVTGYRVFYNIYNSGIATLTFGSFLKGILEIAGTNSDYLVFFYIVGGAFILAGFIMMFIMVINKKRIYE
jgi:hypothetical protein